MEQPVDNSAPVKLMNNGVLFQVLNACLVQQLKEIKTSNYEFCLKHLGGLQVLKTCLVQQLKEIKLKTSNYGFWFEIPSWLSKTRF